MFVLSSISGDIIAAKARKQSVYFMSGKHLYRM